MHEKFRKLAQKIAKAMGNEIAFIAAVIVVFLWAVLGPLFHFSDTWQLVINTSTTIITFLMVFLIQATQNRDARAVQLKLDELIRSTRNARNALSCLEEATEDELDNFEKQFHELREKSRAGRAHEPRRDVH
jgi:low affinity Fe/Cu permease